MIQSRQLASFEEEEEATTRGVQHVNRCLKEACRASGDVHYFTFIVDPQSYSHTVENIFHFSFLIKVCGIVLPVYHLYYTVQAGGESWD